MSLLSVLLFRPGKKRGAQFFLTRGGRRKEKRGLIFLSPKCKVLGKWEEEEDPLSPAPKLCLEKEPKWGRGGSIKRAPLLSSIPLSVLSPIWKCVFLSMILYPSFSPFTPAATTVQFDGTGQLLTLGDLGAGVSEAEELAIRQGCECYFNVLFLSSRVLGFCVHHPFWDP